MGLHVEHDLGFAKFLSLTGYIHSTATASPNLSGQPGKPVAGQTASNAILTGESKTFSQELQLASNAPAGSRFTWIGGLYYFNDNTTVGNAVFGTCVGAVCAAPLPTQTTGRPKTRSYAAYAETTYEILPRTRITAGLRGCWCRIFISGNPQSGSMRFSLPKSTRQDSGNCAAITCMEIRFVSSAIRTIHE